MCLNNNGGRMSQGGTLTIFGMSLASGTQEF